MFNRRVAIRNGSLTRHRQQASTERRENSRKKSPLARTGKIRSIRATATLIFLLILSSFLSLPAQADPPRISNDPLPTTEEEIQALHRAFRGYVAISFPVDPNASCQVTEGSFFEKRFTSFARSWFEVTVVTQCGKNEVESFKVWFQCIEISMRGPRAVVCERSVTPTDLQF